jgi:hypothetical protein
MRTSIDAFAAHLERAHAMFLEAKKQPPGSDEAKKTIHDGKQHITNALRALDSLKHLIGLKPEQVTHIANHLHRASMRLSKIGDAIDLALQENEINGHTTTMTDLAEACPRASQDLEISLGDPLRRTLTEGRSSDHDSLSALTS